MAELPLLDLEGDATARGRRHGQAFADAIRRNIEVYLRRFEASGFDRDRAMKEGAAWDKAITKQSPDYAAEMHGVAVGANLDAATVAFLNARYEIAFTLFGQEARAKDDIAVQEPDGCTTAALLPEANALGHTLLLQNWDWLADIRGNCALLRIRRDDKPNLLCLTEAGIVGGKMGVNEAGIGLVENGLASDHDGIHAYEKPFHVRCREILDAVSQSDAMLAVVQTQRTASANFVIGCAEGEVVDLETSPDAATTIHPKDGRITHANHFVDPRHGPSQMERISPSTLFRAARLDRALAKQGAALNLDTIRTVLSDHLSHPNAICRHPDERQPVAKRTMTLASVVVDLDQRVMWVAEGPPCETPYRRVALNG